MMFTAEVGQRGVMCVSFSAALETFQHVSSCVGSVKYEARWLLMPSSSAFNNTARVYIPHLVSNVEVLFLTRSTYFMPCCL